MCCVHEILTSCQFHWNFAHNNSMRPICVPYAVHAMGAVALQNMAVRMFRTTKTTLPYLSVNRIFECSKLLCRVLLDHV